MSLFSRVSKEEQLAFLNDVLPQAMDQGIMLTAEDIEELYDNQYFPQKVQEEWEESYKNGGRIRRLYNKIPDDNPVKQSILDDNRPYVTNPDGTVSTHLMGSYGNYAIPLVQPRLDGGGVEIVEGNPYSRAMQTGHYIEFDRPRQAKYFAKHYKELPGLHIYDEGDELDGPIQGLISYPTNPIIYTTALSHYFLGEPVEKSTLPSISNLPKADKPIARNIYYRELPYNQNLFDDEDFTDFTETEIASHKLINQAQDIGDIGKRKKTFYAINDRFSFAPNAHFLPRKAQDEFAKKVGGIHKISTKEDPYHSYGPLRTTALEANDEYPIYEYDAQNVKERNNVIIIDPDSALHYFLCKRLQYNIDNNSGVLVGDTKKDTRRFYLNPENGDIYYQISDLNDYKRPFIENLFNPAGKLDKWGNPIIIRSPITNEGFKYNLFNILSDDTDISGYISRKDYTGKNLESKLIGTDNDSTWNKLVSDGYILSDAETGNFVINYDKFSSRQKELTDTDEYIKKWNKEFHERHNSFNSKIK